MKKVLAILIGAAMLAVSCKEEKVDPSLTLNTPSAVTVAQEGEIVTVEFESNVAWTASLNQTSWATLSTGSGAAGVSTVKVTILKNDTEDARECELTIAAETLTQKVKFTQIQKDAIYIETTEYEVSAEEQIIEVKVLSNSPYTVESQVPWMSMVPATKGSTESTAFISVAANTGEAREGTVLVKGAQTIELTIKQAAFEPFFNVKGTDDAGYMYAPVEGGTLYFQIQTNTDFTVTTYNDTFTWQHVSDADGVYTVVIDPSTTYDARTSYIKFVVPAIQVPVIDEETGEPTGETENYVTRVYIAQDGNLQLGWRQEFTADLAAENSDYSAAVSGDFFFVSTGAGVFAYLKADGTCLGQIELPFVPTEITCDDAGNLVAFIGGTYDNVNEPYGPIDPLQVFVLPAASIMDVSAAKCIINYYDAFYGYGLGRIRATGDVTKDGIIDMVSGGYTDNFIISWEVKGGSVAADADGTTPFTDYVSLPFTCSVWSSIQLVGKHVGNTVDSGVFYIGYDDNYNLHYNPSMTALNWQEVLVTGSSWMEGYSCMDLVEWDGHKYVAFIGMTYYPAWGPSYLWIANVDNPSAPVTIAQTPIEQAPDMYCFGNTADVCLEVEDGNLVAYVLESSTACVGKVIYPKL